MTALITGAGSGIGQGIALAMAAAGAERLWLVGRDQAKLQATAAAIQLLPREDRKACDLRCYSADLAAPSECQRLALAVRADAAGRLDVLVNNAGTIYDAPLAATTDAAWAATLAVNLTAPFLLTRELLELLQASPNPSVVNISSTLARKPIANTAAYNASKAALGQLTRSLALELAPARIRVNAVLPAIVDTPLYRGRFARSEDQESITAAASKLHPLGRVGQPADIAHAVVFLASPGASWITGVELPVDGGMLVT